MTMAFDTLKAMKRLTATGVEEAQAEAIIETVGGAMTETLATKDDLALLKADLTAESAGSESRLETKIESLRGEIAGTEGRLETKIAGTEGRLETKIAGTEGRLETKIESLSTEIAKGQITQLRWTVGCMVAIAGVLVSTLLLGT